MHNFILKKTLKGLEALHLRDPVLPQRLRPAFILCDGEKTVAQILELLPSKQGQPQMLDDVSMLIQQGLLELLRIASVEAAIPAEPASQTSAAATQTSMFSPQGTDNTSADRYMHIYAQLSRLVGELGFKGFRLQLALEKAENYESLLDILPQLREAISAQKLRPLEKMLLDFSD